MLLLVVVVAVIIIMLSNLHMNASSVKEHIKMKINLLGILIRLVQCNDPDYLFQMD
jgi:hypothetical protein